MIEISKWDKILKDWKTLIDNWQFDRVLLQINNVLLTTLLVNNDIIRMEFNQIKFGLGFSIR